MTIPSLNIDTHPYIWRAATNRQDVSRLPTGYDKLDSALNGGLISAGAVRIISESGIGEVSFFKHVLTLRAHKHIVFINPPGMVNGIWLNNMGIPPQRVMQICVNEPTEALWATEQCVKSDSVHCALCWLTHIDVKQARRLQVAASSNSSLLLLLMPPKSSNLSIPVSQELLLTPSETGMVIDIKKQRHGWPVEHIEVEFTHTPSNRSIHQAMSQNSENKEHSVLLG